jgi:hypothetical protein
MKVIPEMLRFYYWGSLLVTISKRKLEAANRIRIDNIMSTRKREKRPTMIYTTLDRKHQSHNNRE